MAFSWFLAQVLCVLLPSQEKLQASEVKPIVLMLNKSCLMWGATWHFRMLQRLSELQGKQHSATLRQDIPLNIC